MQDAARQDINGKYHFIGIGGIGMSALAFLALDQGHRVCGSDVKDNDTLAALRQRGAEIYIGHAASQIGDAIRVIYSTAIDPLNPELTAARKRGIPILRRAELLAELMTGHAKITVAGAHGKTTTTAMTAHLLTAAGLNPTAYVGGIVQGGAAHGRWGQGSYFVAEVDESDGSFLCFTPDYSLITNIDKEHMDYYAAFADIVAAYAAFIAKTPRGGFLTACGDDRILSDLILRSGRRAVLYGFGPGNALTASDVEMQAFGSVFFAVRQGQKLGPIRLNIPGRHNILNALACISLGLELSIPYPRIAASLESFTGVNRRFQRKGCVRDILIIDDYGHHPTEIAATLAAAKTLGRRIIAVCQPHRYTRLQALMDEFAESFKSADYVIVTDVYPASEKPIPGVTGAALAARLIQQPGAAAAYVPKAQVVSHAASLARSGDLIITLGAGDVTKMSDALVTLLGSFQYCA
ncbi:MAG: UDP-N-acetylmuramate--L-alanine ligase [Candidatus Omnitrophica bacterium]|nr:UDP-N-acetylmuramate--L-alanine ligase [Candidatus Omnitrophota bacterium]